jgi:predicted lipid carrier protein YhbT
MKARTRGAKRRSKRAEEPERSETGTKAEEGVERFRALQQAVEKIAPELHRDRTLRSGAIVFRAPESEARFALRVSEGGVRVESGGEYADPLLEVIGDPRRLHAILRGAKDARKQFFAGGIRVRGDMHYLSDLGMKLGFLKTPIV